MKDKDSPDLSTLLMALSFLHMYKSFSGDDLILLLTVDAYKNPLMMIENGYKKMSQEIKHIRRVLKAHEIAYKELLRRC